MKKGGDGESTLSALLWGRTVAVMRVTVTL